MYTLADLRKAKAEALHISEAQSSYPAQVAEVFRQVALDLHIPTGSSSEDQDARIQKFKNLPNETELSERAATLLKEALQTKEEFLANTS